MKEESGDIEVIEMEINEGKIKKIELKIGLKEIRKEFKVELKVMGNDIEGKDKDGKCIEDVGMREEIGGGKKRRIEDVEK